MMTIMRKSVHFSRAMLALLALVCLMQVTPAAAQQQTILNIESRTATVTGSSTLYVGEVTVNGEAGFKYLYSEDLTNYETVFAAVRDALSDFKEGQFSALVPAIVGTTEEKGVAVCSDATREASMNSDWKSAAKAGKACYATATEKTSSDVDLYESDADFAAKCASGYSTEYEDATLVDNAGLPAVLTGPLGKLSAQNSDTVTYTVIDGRLVKIIDRNIDYSVEAVTVIYTKADLSDITAVQNVKSAAGAQAAGVKKYFKDGKLVIEGANGSEFDAAGAQVK
jgi:hypothetical protein